MEAKISLIIPIYNAQQYLQDCLDSVAAQTMFDDTQVLLVDDGSTDRSGAICDRFAAQFANVRVLHRANAGVSAARNAGIEEAAGDYIAFADADDLLQPEMLGKLYDAAKKTGAQMALCAYESDPPEGRECVCYPFAQDTAVSRDEAAMFMLRNETCNTLWNKLFLRSLILSNGVRMTDGKRIGEDREFILRYLTFCDTIVYTAYVGYFYRYVPTGAIRRAQTGYADILTQQFASDEALYAALGVDGETFRRGCAVCFCRRICATIDLILRGFSGKGRLSALHALYADDALQAILTQLLPDAAPQLDRFSRCLLSSMQRKSPRQTVFWAFVLRCRLAFRRLRQS